MFIQLHKSSPDLSPRYNIMHCNYNNNDRKNYLKVMYKLIYLHCLSFLRRDLPLKIKELQF